tara:strand:- start:295 stop:420 length:126 start_codon:yes stop_codon:yes gene_type:complete
LTALARKSRLERRILKEIKCLKELISQSKEKGPECMVFDPE